MKKVRWENKNEPDNDSMPRSVNNNFDASSDTSNSGANMNNNVDNNLNSPVSNNYVTKDDLGSFAKDLAKSLKTGDDELSTLTPAARDFVKSVKDIGTAKEYLKSPTENAIESAMGELTQNILASSLGRLTNQPEQQQAAPQPKLSHQLLQIATNNLSSQATDLFKLAVEALGEARVQKGYDVGMNYLEKQNNNTNIAETVLNLDPNNQEHVTYYGKMMGITHQNIAQQRLLDHQQLLYEEIKELQQIQQGENQRPSNVVDDNEVLEPYDEGNQQGNEQVNDNHPSVVYPQERPTVPDRHVPQNTEQDNEQTNEPNESKQYSVEEIASMSNVLNPIEQPIEYEEDATAEDNEYTEYSEQDKPVESSVESSNQSDKPKAFYVTKRPSRMQKKVKW